LSGAQAGDSVFSVIVEGLAYGGQGVARLDGKAVFIPGAYPGDTVFAKVEKDKKSYIEASLVRVAVPSPNRVEAPCIYAGDCGGCPWMGLEYASQIEWKRRIVQEQLKRIGGLDVEVSPALSSATPLGYRARARMKVVAKRGKVSIGFRKAGSHDSIAAVDKCVALNSTLNTMLKEAREYLRLNAKTAEKIHEIELETSPSGPSGRITLNAIDPLPAGFADGLLKACPSLKGVSVRNNRSFKSSGDVSLFTTTGGGVRLFFAPGVFSQINPEQNVKMVERIVELAGPAQGRTALDLYCGMGNIAIPLTVAGFGVTGVESVKQAVDDANRNRGLIGLFTANFIHGDSGHEAATFAQRGFSFDVTVLDPPKGGAKGLADVVSGITKEMLIYVSCDPPALARDLKAFAELGFAVESVDVFDMFPQTARVEAVAVLRKR